MKKIVISVLILTLSVIFCACSNKNGLESNISENRYNILKGEKDGISVRAHFVCRESPYSLDGIRGEMVELLEIFLTAPDNTCEYTVSFDDGGKTYGGQLNYSSVKRQHDLTVPFKKKQLSFIDLAVTFDGSTSLIRLDSVIIEPILTPAAALESLNEGKKEFFDNMTVDSRFDGEIHIRLLEEGEKCYYFIGLVNKTGKIFAFLMNAKSGVVIAQKEINYRTKLG